MVFIYVLLYSLFQISLEKIAQASPLLLATIIGTRHVLSVIRPPADHVTYLLEICLFWSYIFPDLFGIEYSNIVIRGKDRHPLAIS
jgi:hypothetical protein